MADHKIPVLNLKEQFATLAPELEQAVLAVLRSGNYILGEQVALLEQGIASLCGCQYGIGVANGTDALVLALWALNIGPGDEVITPSFTFAATAEAIALRGATPVFVDANPNTFNIDAHLIEAAITKRTKAIMPVHLYGMPADMEAIVALAKKYSLKIIEDNAQAVGALYRGSPTGSFGDIACLSFYPTKNLGACGDAGMLVTNNATLNERLRKLRAHGMKKRYYHEELGVNSRLDELQAVVLNTKLPHLAQWNQKRAQLAKQYSDALSNIQWLQLPELTDSYDQLAQAKTNHVWHQYTVVVKLGEAQFAINSSLDSKDAGTIRDTVMSKLSEQGIGSMCYYPIPLHVQEAFAHYGYNAGDFPITERLAKRVISLPMYPELSEDSIKTVAAALEKIGQEMLSVSSQSRAYSGVSLR